MSGERKVNKTMSDTKSHVIEIPEPIEPPSGWAIDPESRDGGITSNFDGTIHGTVRDALLNGPLVAHHYAWEFCGTVWHAEGVWFETVRRYHVPVASYSSPDLEALRDHVNDKWGWD